MPLASYGAPASLLLKKMLPSNLVTPVFRFCSTPVGSARVSLIAFLSSLKLMSVLGFDTFSLWIRFWHDRIIFCHRDSLESCF